MSPELRRALIWWCDILQQNLVQLRLWAEPLGEIAHLFCDASGNPPYLGAVLFVGTKKWFTHMAAPASVIKMFQRRKDNQIMGLELLSITLGLQTFKEQLHGMRVVIHSDNKGSEVRLLVSAFFSVNCSVVCFLLRRRPLHEAQPKSGTMRNWSMHNGHTSHERGYMCRSAKTFAFRDRGDRPQLLGGPRSNG